MPSHKSTDVRKIAIEYYNENNISQKEVAKIFQISEKTFWRWLDKYENTKELERKKRKAVSYKITQKEVDYVKRLIETYPTYSIHLLWNKMSERFDNFSISESQLRRVIRDNNITRKRTRIRHYPETRYNKPINLNEMMNEFYKLKSFP